MTQSLVQIHKSVYQALVECSILPGDICGVIAGYYVDFEDFDEIEADCKKLLLTTDGWRVCTQDPIYTQLHDILMYNTQHENLISRIHDWTQFDQLAMNRLYIDHSNSGRSEFYTHSIYWIALNRIRIKTYSYWYKNESYEREYHDFGKITRDYGYRKRFRAIMKKEFKFISDLQNALTKLIQSYRDFINLQNNPNGSTGRKRYYRKKRK